MNFTIEDIEKILSDTLIKQKEWSSLTEQEDLKNRGMQDFAAKLKEIIYNKGA
jgi:hypothetical protein